jgi:hypothetical protein
MIASRYFSGGIIMIFILIMQAGGISSIIGLFANSKENHDHPRSEKR